MKRSMKKFFAVLLVVMLSVGNVISTGVFAAEETVGENKQETTVEKGEENKGETKSETEQKTEEAQEKQENTGCVGTTVKPDIKVEYVVLDKSNIFDAETQKIVVGISNSEKVDSARINLKNTTTGAVVTLDAKTIIEGAVLFETPAANNMVAGTYKVDSISYLVKGNECTEISDTTGIKAAFGVNVNAEKKADGYVVPEEDKNNLTPESMQVEEQVIGELSKIKASYGSNGKPTVVIDPGHGGSDSGAKCTHNGVTYYERDIALKISLYCKEILDATGNFNVYLTRTDNTSTLMNREQRLDFAKSVNADILISVHLNSTTGTPQNTSNGAEVWIPNSSYNIENHEISKATADNILGKLVALGLTNRGVKVKNATDGDTYPDGSIADYYGINYWGKMKGIPAMIVEHCFINSTVDLAHFNSDARIRELAQADAEGIIKSVKYFDGNNPIFDATYYADKYYDLKNAFGYDYAALYNHFVTCGMSEGRQASAEFNVFSYKRKYRDLRNAFGNDLPAYYQHYLNCGKKEGRVATGCYTLQNPITTYEGVDYSAVYDYYYYSTYGDLQRAFGEDDIAMLRHFVDCGMSEGRRGRESFDVRSYRNQYRDLRNAFGSNLEAYYMHYINCGQREGRATTGCYTLQNGVTVYEGVDYSAVYDYSYYSTYGDLKRAFGEDEHAMLRHFVICGMSEGRQGRESFDVRSYRNQYRDLRNAFGSDLEAYYMHYINCGQREGRATTGCYTLQNGVTVYEGVDYSAVYDYSYYSTYGDLKRAFGEDEHAMLRHFVICGMSEGRQGKATFNVRSYKNRYYDLRNAFGDDLEAYFMHYINCGQAEGRVAVDN